MINIIGQFLLKRYRVDDFIGRGSIGEVYKVWDTERATYFAIKILKADLARDNIFFSRFQRECLFLKKLQNPHIVRFYGLEQDKGFVFTLMEYIEGSSLKSLIHNQENGLALSRVLEVARSACNALQYAHQLGIVHGDVKPGNILVNKQGRAFVTDFGLATMSEAVTRSLIEASNFTYASPEILQGEVPRPRSDQYSLGIVLYEMVTGGKLPFTGDVATIAGAVG